MLHVGFTGTRDGMTVHQQCTFSFLMQQFAKAGEFTLHHGDCIGSDDQAHDLSVGHAKVIVLHPPLIDRFCNKRVAVISVTGEAWSTIESRDKLEYRARNKQIVLASRILIAAPKRMMEERRSGTWMTVRLAREHRKMVMILDPQEE